MCDANTFEVHVSVRSSHICDALRVCAHAGDIMQRKPDQYVCEDGHPYRWKMVYYVSDYERAAEAKHILETCLVPARVTVTLRERSEAFHAQV